MKTIALLSPGMPEYQKAVAFAQRIYWEALSFRLVHGPDLFLAIINEVGEISGAIGLNVRIKNSLFVHDPHIQAWLQDREPHTIAEQSVLALERAEIGLPILFAALAALAEARGISGIIFAGIDVSLRTIEHLGLSLETLSPADRRVLLPSEEGDYEKWFSLYTPIVCVVHTAGTREIAERTLARWRHRIVMSPELADELGIPILLDAGRDLS